ncbi:MAG TPA: hypothetical protein VI141_06670, partial [Acidimicrobiia bacterium]
MKVDDHVPIAIGPHDQGSRLLQDIDHLPRRMAEVVLADGDHRELCPDRGEPTRVRSAATVMGDFE